jgi:flavin reductase
MNTFTNAMRRAVSGVCIVTTDGAAGRFGLTVSSMTSVSSEPPMLLVCLNRNSVAHDAIAGNRRFAINLLAAHQQPVAAMFAGSSSHRPAYDFDNGDWSVTASGLPRLLDSAAIFECELDTAIKAGTHSIFLGCVARASSEELMPLAYSNREYGLPLNLEAANAFLAGKRTVSAQVAR